MNIVAQFWELLKHHGCRIEDPRPRFAPALEQVIEEEMAEEETLGAKEPDTTAPLSDHVALVEKDHDRCLLQVATTTFDKGFWGVGVSDLARLERQPLPWALVLLHGQATRGYWFDGRTVATLADTKWQRISPDGPHHRVRESEETQDAVPFQSATELLDLLAKLGR